MEGISYGREVPRGSSARAGEGTTGRPWPSGGQTAVGPGSAGTASSLIRELSLSDGATADFKGVAGAYSRVQFRPTSDLVWLINWIIPIRGLGESALLITAYPLDTKYDIMSWAWWGPGLAWIGPRHTNYHPSGSICSFEPSDGTWLRGRPLVNLLDLHVVWIVRHLFMRYFGRWPGPQVFHTPWERLFETRPGELCGGCGSGRRYEDCCREADEKLDPVERLIGFRRRVGDNWNRRPPQAVSEFVYGLRKIPPSVGDIALDRPITAASKSLPLVAFRREG